MKVGPPAGTKAAGELTALAMADGGKVIINLIVIENTRH